MAYEPPSRCATSRLHAACWSARSPWLVSSSYRRCSAFSSWVSRCARALSSASVLAQGRARSPNARCIRRACTSARSKCVCSWPSTVRRCAVSFKTIALTQDCRGRNPAITRNSNTSPLHFQPEYSVYEIFAPSAPSEGGGPWKSLQASRRPADHGNAWSAARSRCSTSSSALDAAADGDPRLEGLGAGPRGGGGGTAWLAHPKPKTSKTTTPSLTEGLQSVPAAESPPRAPESRRSAESQTGARLRHPDSSPSPSCPPARAAAGDCAQR